MSASIFAEYYDKNNRLRRKNVSTWTPSHTLTTLTDDLGGGTLTENDIERIEKLAKQDKYYNKWLVLLKKYGIVEVVAEY